mmetsp:Transcript_35108/g.108765  ORF Transcript_35108/g.108765 Transcript_35108/m.108765 type:complete len:265 (-) Transcript_35108:392-1186(-)
MIADVEHFAPLPARDPRQLGQRPPQQRPALFDVAKFSPRPFRESFRVHGTKGLIAREERRLPRRRHHEIERVAPVVSEEVPHAGVEGRERRVGQYEELLAGAPRGGQRVRKAEYRVDESRRGRLDGVVKLSVDVNPRDGLRDVLGERGGVERDAAVHRQLHDVRQETRLAERKDVVEPRAVRRHVIRVEVQRFAVGPSQLVLTESAAAEERRVARNRPSVRELDKKPVPAVEQQASHREGLVVGRLNRRVVRSLREVLFGFVVD